MNSTTLTRDRARVMGISTVVLAATLAALLAILSIAKPSGAQELNIVTVEPTQVGFGAVQVGTDSQEREIYIRNTGDAVVQLGLDLLGTNLVDFRLVGHAPGDILTIGAGQTETLRVVFSPLSEGQKLATLNLSTVGSTTTTSIGLSGTGTTVNPLRGGCTIAGTNRGELLTGTPRRDVICALGGNDRVSALAGNDAVGGGSGKDVIRSSRGRDTLRGGASADRITDKAGNDRLFGQGGRDRLNTKDGKRGDVLNGGPQRDRCVKSAGDRARSC